MATIDATKQLSPAALAAAIFILAGCLYLWRINHAMSSTPADARKLANRHWTTEELREAYRRVQEAPTNVRPFLFGAKQRRYVVTGGSGLVGGWIVQHLLQRGEDPAALRVLDLRPSLRKDVAKYNVQVVVTDIADPVSVAKAFNAPWDPKVAQWPLTVFHTVAYVKPDERKSDLMPMYDKVNVEGTQHVLDAAKVAGASCLIATSSGSVGIRPVNFFFAPWKSMPDHFVQVAVNAEPPNPDGPLEAFGSCYSYSKYLAEKLTCEADDKTSGFRTGCIRPGHAIYGHGVSMPSSFAYQYLTRGGAPTWLKGLVANLVDAQNVSIAHLAFENMLIKDPKSALGGRSYCCTDPDKPHFWDDIYRATSVLAHPMRPVNYPTAPFALMMLLSYAVEAYTLLRYRYLKFLPRVPGDLAVLQPAMLQMSSIHMIYDDRAAQRDLGYKPPITTLEGLCHQVLYFNDEVQAQLDKAVAEGKGGETKPQSPSSPADVPKPPLAM